MKVEIKNRWTAAVIFAAEVPDDTPEQFRVRAAVELAVSSLANLRAADLRAADLRSADLSAANLSAANLSAANLSDANLRAANLRDADLRSADLRAANLSDANLSDANLRAADLRSADLRAANLSDANLSDANLRAADLRSADLRAANLSDANLSDANLSAANLRDADLRDAKNLTYDQLIQIRDDMWAVLSSAPREVQGLRQALVDGKVDGSTYHGDCACLVGTIANIRHCDVHELGPLKPNASRPIERWFMGIKKGDTPDTNVCAKFALQWTDEWLTAIRSANFS